MLSKTALMQQAEVTENTLVATQYRTRAIPASPCRPVPRKPRLSALTELTMPLLQAAIWTACKVEILSFVL